MTDPEFADATYVEPLTPEFVEKVIAAGAPGRAAGHPRRADRAQHRHRAVRERRAREVRRPAHRRRRRRDQPRRGPAAVQGHRPLDRRRRPALDGLRHASTRRWPPPRRSATRSSSGPASPWAASARASPPTSRCCAGWPPHGLADCPVHAVLIEESVLGWKEYELELMRDRSDNVVVICSIENIDAMGVHTGDSVTVAPAMTLTDREYQQMRDLAIAVLREVGVDTGGCNIQFAVHPETGRIVVIEMNPRVSRSSALASKATGFPIAKIAAKLAIGYTLDEIPNDITGVTPAAVRADAGLRRGQDPAVRLREVPRRRPAADHDDEERRRGHGHRPQLRRGAGQGDAVHRDEGRRLLDRRRADERSARGAARAAARARRRPALPRRAGAARPARRSTESPRPVASTHGSSTRSRWSTRSAATSATRRP